MNSENMGLYIWIMWIMGYICYPSVAILINSTPSSFFRSMVGICQGYLLSFYLFIYGTDILSWVLREAVKGSNLDSYVPVPGAQSISHLLLANDCLLPGRTFLRNTVIFSRILDEYCNASSRVNL